MAGSKHLVSQHIERMSAKILEDHPEVIREYVKGRQGVYALYDGKRLYYVGLASELRARMKRHQHDRHAGKWDKFSLYIIDESAHLRELEALVIRIAMPTGNRSKTKFARSQNLVRYFKRKVVEFQKKTMDVLFGARKSRLRAPESAHGAPPLAPYVSARLPIRMKYKGRTYRGTVRPDGTIKSRRRILNSPSLAASAVTHRPMNGWSWWRYEVVPGTWQQLHELRGGRKKRRKAK